MKSLCFIAIISVCAQKAYQQHSTTAILDRILGQGYDWHVQPGVTAAPPHPTEVTVNMYVRRIAISDNAFDVEMTFRQNWKDSRLNYEREANKPNFLVLPPEDSTRKIWVPDTFFQSGYDVKAHSIPNPNVLTRIYPDGNILSSQRLSMKVACPMSFETYPVDNQVCNLDVASYSYTTDDIFYAWKQESAVQIKHGLSFSLPQFILKNVSASYCSSVTKTGNYSCLRAGFMLQRTISKQLCSKLYVIPLFLVLLSWLPLIINAQSIIVRVVIGFSCLITLILHWNIISADLPKVAYANRADAWLSGCFGFIVASIVQLVIYVWIVRILRSRQEHASATQGASKAADENAELLTPKEPSVKLGRKIAISFLVDIASLVIFILAFVAFVIHIFTAY